jgi:hypothetical protein
MTTTMTIRNVWDTPEDLTAEIDRLNHLIPTLKDPHLTMATDRRAACVRQLARVLGLDDTVTDSQGRTCRVKIAAHQVGRVKPNGHITTTDPRYEQVPDEIRVDMAALVPVD